MKELFLEVVKLSLSGSIFVAAVVLLRLVFRKAPRWVFCLLWALAAARLALPVQVETELSVIPPAISDGQAVEGVMSGFVGDTTVYYEGSGDYEAAINAGRDPVLAPGGRYVVTQTGSLEAPVTVGGVLAWVWLGGIGLMLGYAVLSWAMLRRRVRTAVRAEGNIWECGSVDSPFVLGLFCPRIYLPFGLEDPDRAHVIAHERAHLRRGDHWWKPLGFLILSVYWFNPVIWVAYVLLCRDIEGACDEKVIGSMTKDQIRAYSRALLNCSVHRRRIAACPVAFGEVGIKARIQNVMHYKKPAFWIVLTAVAASVVAAVLLLTDPAEELPGETMESTKPAETQNNVPTDPFLGTMEDQNGSCWRLDNGLFGVPCVIQEQLDYREKPDDPGNGVFTYRFFYHNDGTKPGKAGDIETDLLTLECITCDIMDYDGDGTWELLARVDGTERPYRLYDLIDGEITCLVPELIPDSVLTYSELLDGDLYLYKERWIRFFREPQTYITELAKLEEGRFLYACPSGVIPEEISEEQFRQGYRAIRQFLEGGPSEGQRRAAYRMLLELDQNCSPETAVELTGPDPFHRLLDKRRYARENSAEWRNCLAQIGVLFDRDPGGLLEAMATRKETYEPEITWLVTSRFYYDREILEENLKRMENSAGTEQETALAKAFRDSFEAMEPPVMDAATLLSGTAEQLWNAFVWDTEKTVRCFRNAQAQDIYKMRNLLWGTPTRPEQKNLKKCYDAVDRLLSRNPTGTEKDVAYMLLIQLEFAGPFREAYVPGEPFDYQRFFEKATYTDGASAEAWASQCKDIFRQSPQEFLLALNAWDGEEEGVDRILTILAYAFYPEDAEWFEETLKSLQGFSGDSSVFALLKKLEEIRENAS